MSLPYIPKDVLRLILLFVDDPIAYQRCCMLNKEFREFLGKFKEERMAMFSKIIGTFCTGPDTYENLKRKTIANIEILKASRLSGDRPGVVATILPDGTLHGKVLIVLYNNTLGTDTMEVNYFRGRLEGPYKCYRNHIIQEEGGFKRGKLHGEISDYHYLINKETDPPKYSTHHFEDGKRLCCSLHNFDGDVRKVLYPDTQGFNVISGMIGELFAWKKMTKEILRCQAKLHNSWKRVLKDAKRERRKAKKSLGVDA